MSSEALRAALYALGATLVAVGGFDDALVVAGIPALGILSAGVAKMLMAVGTLIIGYGKTAKKLGDFSLKDVSDILGESLRTQSTIPAAQAKAMVESQRPTSPVAGPSDK